MAPGKWGHGRALCRRQIFSSTRGHTVSYRLYSLIQSQAIHGLYSLSQATVSYSQAHMVQAHPYSLCHTVFAIQSRKHESCSGLEPFLLADPESWSQIQTRPNKANNASKGNKANKASNANKPNDANQPNQALPNVFKSLQISSNPFSSLQSPSLQSQIAFLCRR